MNWLNFDLHFPITNPIWTFLLVLVIILVVPVLLNKLRIPHLIGMILAGVAVGEYGLGILERDSGLELFGEIGFYYIMFLAGLEMDLKGWKKNRLKTLVFGLFSFFIPLSLGIGSSLFLFEYGLAASVLLASMYASHTLVAYPTVSRYGLSRLRSVGIVVGGTVITVILSLLILSVVSGGYADGGVTPLFGILLALKLFLLCFIIIFFFPRISRWFFRKYEDSITQFVFVLALLFLSAGLFELAGLEGILGAFIAGLVLNRLIPNLSPLMNRLEFVGSSLFIPCFLIGVGMIVDVRKLFAGGEALEVAGVMVVVVLFSKWLAAWGTQKLFRMKGCERTLMFGLSSAQAAVALAVMLIGSRIEISPGVPLLNDDIQNGTLVMILFTCIVSAIVTEYAARKIVVQDDFEGMGKKIQEEEKILVPIANPETIENLVSVALTTKKTRDEDGIVTLHVINDNNTTEMRMNQAKRCLEHSALIAAEANVRAHAVTRFDQNIVSGIVHTLKEYNASEIIIGLHHKMTLVDSFWGVLTENLLNTTRKQVMIVKCLMPINTLRRIVVAVPPKAEYEAGFFKWIERLCRMGGQLGCRVHFFASSDTLRYLEAYIIRKHETLRYEFTELADWDDLLMLTGQVNYDHLLVIVSARRGFISYDPLFEKLPLLIAKYFSNNSLMILYPDQYEDQQETISFSAPIHHKKLYYDGVGKWFYKWFKKD